MILRINDNGTIRQFDIAQMSDISNIVADEYDATSTYAVGDIVLYNGTLYECTTAIPSAEEWTVAHWSALTLSEDFVKKTDYATANTAGVAKVNSDYGVMLYNNILAISAPADIRIKTGGDLVAPIVAAKQHISTFYGLAKAAGDTSQAQSDNAVGNYTADAKSAIRTMFGAVGNEDWASASDGGIVKVDSVNGIGIESGHKLYIEYAPSNLIKAGTGNYRPITPPRQHESVFYGLAKAAGDSTQSASSNAIGTYTDAAKTAIKSMLGVTDAPEIFVGSTTPSGYTVYIDPDGSLSYAQGVNF